MVAAYVSSTARAVGATTADVPCTLPGGGSVGDKIFAFAWANNLTSTWTVSAGSSFTPVTSDASIGMALMVRTVDGTETAPTFTRVGTSGTAGVILVRVSGAGNPQAASFTSAAASTSLVLGSVTAAASNLLVQVATTLNNTADTWTAPGTATRRTAAGATATGNAIPFAVGDETVGAGATGTRTWTRGLSQSSRGFMVAINPAPSQTVTPGGIASTAAVGSPTVTRGAVTISPGGRATTAALGSPTVQPGAVTLQAGGIASTAVVGAPILTTTAAVAPSGIAPSSGVGQPVIVAEQFVEPGGVAPTSAVGAPSLTTGSVNVQAGGIASTSDLGAPVILSGGSLISPESVPGASNVGTPLVEPGEVLIVAQSVAGGALVGTPGLAVTISPPGIGSLLALGVPRVQLGPSMIGPSGITSTLRVGEPTVAQPGPADECWPVDLSCVSDWDDVVDGEPRYSAAQKERAIRLAGMTMRMLTGFRVGGCPITVRPCSQACGERTYRSYPLHGGGDAPWAPYVIDGEWLNVGCGCTGSCSCGGVEAVWLGSPASRISEVKIDGAQLSPSAYRLDRGGYLVRTDGGRWPTCQYLDRPDTEEGTWSVTYVPGHPVDGNGAFAAGVLAGEYVRACTGGECDLPEGVTRIVRQGVSMDLVTGLFPEGRTGIRTVDVYLERWNPGGLRAPARVYSPDVRRPR